MTVKEATMSVLIKGMEMPKSCDDCYIANCPNDIGYTDMGKCSRHINCPIIEVPEPHGRLGDLDALKDLYHYNTHDSDIDKAWTCNIRRSLDNAPTVIPASEE
jgi:hypothetical protein